MQNKAELTYGRVFREVFSLPTEGYNIKMYLSDYEHAPANILSQMFTRAEPIKCAFHLSQSNRKWARGHEMTSFYSNDDLANWIALFSKIAYLPLRDVIHGYIALMDAFNDLINEGVPTLGQQTQATGIFKLSETYGGFNFKPILAFIDYFRKTYLFCGTGLSLRPATFPLHTWNVNKYVRAQLPVTNNSVESWNREYKAHFAGGGNPDRSKVIQFQIGEEEAVRHAIERHEDKPEEPFRRIRPTQQRSEELLHALLVEWEEKSLEDIHSNEDLVSFLCSVQERLWFAKGLDPDLDDIEESEAESSGEE